MVKPGKWLKSLWGGKTNSTSMTNDDPLSRDGKANEQKKPTTEKSRRSFGRSKNCGAEVLPNREHYREIMDIAELELDQNKHAMAVAAAAAAAADVAVAAAQAAAAVVRLTSDITSSGHSLFHRGIGKEEWAAIKIQTVFRGHLARRAFRALKGLVKLQALVRGHIVRKQAAVTLRCMQALVKAQTHVRACRVRMSEEGQGVQRHLLQRRHSNRPWRSVESDECWNRNSTKMEFEERNQNNKTRLMESEHAMSCTSQQLRKMVPRQNSPVMDCNPDKSLQGWSWLDRWMASLPSESPFPDGLVENRSDCDRNLEDGAKIVEMDAAKLREDMKKWNESTRSVTCSVQPNISTPLASSNASAYPSQSFRSLASVNAAIQDQLSIQISLGGRRTVPTSPASDKAAMATSHGIFLDEECHLSGESVLSTTRSSPPTDFGKRNKYGYLGDIFHTHMAFPSYMTTTQSSKAKVRSQSAPKYRLEPPDKITAGTRKGFSSQRGKRPAAPVCMQRSSSQVHVSRKGSAGLFRLDRSTLSLKDSKTSSVHGDFERRTSR
eukprot:c19940_g1_i2 orf=1427-3076(+)